MTPAQSLMLGTWLLLLFVLYRAYQQIPIYSYDELKRDGPPEDYPKFPWYYHVFTAATVIFYAFYAAAPFLFIWLLIRWQVMPWCQELVYAGMCALTLQSAKLMIFSSFDIYFYLLVVVLIGFGFRAVLNAIWYLVAQSDKPALSYCKIAVGGLCELRGKKYLRAFEKEFPKAQRLPREQYGFPKNPYRFLGLSVLLLSLYLFLEEVWILPAAIICIVTYFVRDFPALRKRDRAEDEFLYKVFCPIKLNTTHLRSFTKGNFLRFSVVLPLLCFVSIRVLWWYSFSSSTFTYTPSGQSSSITVPLSSLSPVSVSFKMDEATEFRRSLTGSSYELKLSIALPLLQDSPEGPEPIELVNGTNLAFIVEHTERLFVLLEANGVVIDYQEPSAEFLEKLQALQGIKSLVIKRVIERFAGNAT